VLPVLLHFGPLYVYTYGVLIALGGVFSAMFWKSRVAKIGIKKDEDFWLLVNVILISGFLGGRILFLFEYTGLFSPEFWSDAFSLNRGFSVMGAFVGVLCGVYWFSRRIKTAFLHVLDYVCQAAPVWHFFGRLGCFAAGCCYGRPTDVPWAVTFTNPASQVDPELLGRHIHPTQLYEAFGNLAIAGLLYRFVLLPTEKGRLRPGTLCCLYFILYGGVRFVEEFYRGDAIPLSIGLTAAQGFCLALAAGGLTVLALIYRKPCTPS
jgi:phosphatidylglycerol:prolipoprotein diacylglycerol transferase